MLRYGKTRLASRAIVLTAACGLLCAAATHSVHAQKPAASAAPGPASAPARVPATYQVVRGDTLFRIAGKTRHQGVSLHQMLLALYRANPDAFLEGNINQLLVGRVLNVPGRDAVAAVDAAQATREVRVLLAKPLAPVQPPPAAPEVKEAPPPKPPVEPPPQPPKPAARAPALAPEQAAARFEQGAVYERKGELAAAMKAYLEAGEAGHGPAQKKLGDIYNAGNSVVRRDYETALKWYQKARAQGIEIPKPVTNPGVRH